MLKIWIKNMQKPLKFTAICSIVKLQIHRWAYAHYAVARSWQHTDTGKCSTMYLISSQLLLIFNLTIFEAMPGRNQ